MSDTKCENCGDKLRNASGYYGNRQICEDCGRKVCHVCKDYLGDIIPGSGYSFCRHGNIPYWQVKSLNDVDEREIVRIL